MGLGHRRGQLNAFFSGHSDWHPARSASRGTRGGVAEGEARGHSPGPGCGRIHESQSAARQTREHRHGPDLESAWLECEAPLLDLTCACMEQVLDLEGVVAESEREGSGKARKGSGVAGTRRRMTGRHVAAHDDMGEGQAMTVR